MDANKRQRYEKISEELTGLSGVPGIALADPAGLKRKRGFIRTLRWKLF